MPPRDLIPLSMPKTPPGGQQRPASTVTDV
jgi:hypothetical protein